MKEYVCGFLFSPDYKSVALIRKNRPEWQAGKLNGIGGRIEPGETPLEAMRREFEEETGVLVTSGEWELFCHHEWNTPARVWFFAATGRHIADVETKTDEAVVIRPVDDLGDTISNLPWLVPMAIECLQRGCGYVVAEPC